jgi:hypothetical protein
MHGGVTASARWTQLYYKLLRDAVEARSGVRPGVKKSYDRSG